MYTTLAGFEYTPQVESTHAHQTMLPYIRNTTQELTVVPPIGVL